jgi:hypothetical protein
VSLCVSTLNTLKGPEPLFDDVTAKTRPTHHQHHKHPTVLDDHPVVSAQSQLSTCGDARP